MRDTYLDLLFLHDQLQIGGSIAEARFVDVRLQPAPDFFFSISPLAFIISTRDSSLLQAASKPDT